MADSKILPDWIQVSRGIKVKETGFNVEPYEYFSVGYFVALSEENIDRATVTYSVVFTVELRYWNSDCKSVAVEDKTGEIEIKQWFILPIKKELQKFVSDLLAFLEIRYKEAETTDEKIAIREEIQGVSKRYEVYEIDLDEWAKKVTDDEARLIWSEYRERKLYGGLIMCEDGWTINIIKKNIERISKPET